LYLRGTPIRAKGLRDRDAPLLPSRAKVFHFADRKWSISRITRSP